MGLTTGGLPACLLLLLLLLRMAKASLSAKEMLFHKRSEIWHMAGATMAGQAATSSTPTPAPGHAACMALHCTAVNVGEYAHLDPAVQSVQLPDGCLQILAYLVT
jgi:hypothetical protein